MGSFFFAKKWEKLFCETTFYKDTEDGGKLKDEDGLGLTITDSTGADYDHWKCIETKDKMKYTFGRDGYLRFDEDPDGNKVTYEYEPNSTQNYIPYITDPTGAKIEFVYKNDASLSRITAIRDMAGCSIQYTYDSAGNLASITYPDGEKTTFTYDSSHKLLSVTNPEGYSISYQYTNDFRVPRVSRITEKGAGSQTGQEMKISYANGNTTTFEEPGLDGEIGQTADNRKTTYHFDNMGRPTDVLENDGSANHYTYFTSGMKNHKLGKEGSVQKTVYNLLKNPVFDTTYGTSSWYTCRLSDQTKGTVTTDAGYIGTKCAKLAKTDATSEEGICQDVTLAAGTYTLSAYVKAENLSAGGGSTEGKGVCLMVLQPDGTRISGERMLDTDTDAEVDGGWERLTLTFTLTAQKSVTVFAGILGMSGTLRVSAVQLEEGKAANKLNLLLNSGFETLSGSAPANWTFSSDVQGTKYASDSTHGRCAAITGRRDKALSCKQTVHVSGSEGDIYSVSCHVKGCGIPGRKFSLVAEVVYGTNDVKKHEFACNPNISGWQFVSGVFSTDDENSMTKKTYSAINVYLQYDNQVNQVLFDGMQLVRDDGESYVYDSEGNLISAVSAAEKSHFVFDGKDSLTRMGNIDGTAFDYGYDTKKHLVNASNSEGVRYRFTYDEKGMPTGMTVEGGKHLASVTPGRIYYIRDQYSGHYMEVQGQSTPPAVQLHAFTGAADQKWKVIDCKNGYINLEAQSSPGRMLDLIDNSQSDGAVIQIHGSNNHDAQKWKLHPNQDGSYQLSCKGTGDKKGPSNWAQSTAEGQAVLSYPLAEGRRYQNWHFEPADEGTISAVPEDGKVYYLRGRRSGQYVDIYKAGTTAGTKGMQHYYNGGKNQQFRLTKQEGIYFYLEPLHAPGMVLAKSGTNDSGYPRLALEAKVDGKETQLFWFDETEPDRGTGYAIVCKDGNTALDVMNYSYASNADIILIAHTKVQDNKWWITG
ncbi:MAG: RICIN domain-containing protein [Blautia sp.]|uniref:RICIN domain-containing protein n=1 Tax=Blautia sp. TaxID=1955243 RepID=UPI0025C53FFA|nr:RICIN domain-containing protein [Blautia sp.]MCI7448603.1 RICIN domain-containing protein [Blautia sp.]